MTQFIIDLIGLLGYFGIVILMLVEMVIPVIPSEIIMPFAGFAASEGKLDITLVIISGLIGSCLGALVLYGVGRFFHREQILKFITKYGGWLGLEKKDLDKSETWFRDHSKLSVLGGRVVPGVRSFVALPAGYQHMAIVKYIALTAIGTGIWSALLSVVGYFLGEKYGSASQIVNYISYGVVIIMIILAARFIYKRKLAKD